MNRSLRTSSALWLVITIASFIPLSLFGDGPRIGVRALPLNLVQVLHAPDGTDTSWEKLRGKVVVLDFWATWCGPCVASIPHWNELARQFQDKPVVFIAVSNENEPTIAYFLKHKAIKTWIGLEGTVQSTRDRYGIVGIPTTVIVNQDGIVVAVAHPISIEAKHLQEVLDTKHSSLPPPPPETIVADDSKTTVAVKNEPPLFEVSIRRSGPRQPGRPTQNWSWRPDFSSIDGRWASLKTAIGIVYQVREGRLRLPPDLPEVDYDFSIKVPSGNRQDIEQLFGSALRRTFDLTARRVSEERDVLVLSVVNTNAPGLELYDPSIHGGVNSWGGGQLKASAENMDWLSYRFDNLLGVPVVDETSLTNLYNIWMNWKMSPAELLETQFSSRIWRVLEDDKNTNAWNKLTESDRKVVAAIQGKLPETEFGGLDPELQERIRLLRSELAKPEDKRFAPDPSSIRQAVEGQLGLKLTPARRKIELLVVDKVISPQPDTARNE
jgi:uncharacterized protein (TIGR03435 family)